ncbi:hypothetical protein ACJQWK_07177 [Exserohilum turcicum]|uniref:Uncharacterized protein n=1 Tax=Exserohilum turcicum (strain 28A) TaxID=671987 RepID=R0K511_EXST2|nr:uncharacterized protein SETTUDRAFT_163493 [Exserohilum turcica Et28A]EOA84594.1 hypothetical protein SETTUDRAFT_163493 [Exserohilum turcica Et28A]
MARSLCAYCCYVTCVFWNADDDDDDAEKAFTEGSMGRRRRRSEGKKKGENTPHFQPSYWCRYPTVVIIPTSHIPRRIASYRITITNTNTNTIRQFQTQVFQES